MPSTILIVDGSRTVRAMVREAQEDRRSAQVPPFGDVTLFDQ